MLKQKHIDQKNKKEEVEKKINITVMLLDRAVMLREAGKYADATR